MKKIVSTLLTSIFLLSALSIPAIVQALAADEILQNSVYNSELGYSLLFPAEWGEYSITRTELDFGEFGTATAEEIGTVDTANIITVSQHTTQDWINMSGYTGTRPEMLGISNGQILGYTTNETAFDTTAQWVLDHMTVHKNRLSDTEGIENENAIQYLLDTEVVSGYPDGTFKPELTINRAELMKIITEAKGSTPAATEFNNCFPDVEDEWFAVYVCFAKEQNWIQGYPDGEFKPANEVNKVEALKMIVNSQGLDIPGAVNDLLFDDVDNSAWYAPFVKSAYDNGLLDIEGTVYGVDEFITRSEVSENIYRALLLRAFNTGTSSTSDTSTQTPEEIVASISGYAVFTSDSFHFSIEYPETWYYQGLATDPETGERPYEFGPGLADEEPALITVLIGTGEIPEGTIIDMNGKNLVVTEEGTITHVYFIGETTGRLFHLHGDAAYEEILLNMASSITDLEPTA